MILGHHRAVFRDLGDVGGYAVVVVEDVKSKGARRARRRASRGNPPSRASRPTIMTVANTSK